MDASYVWGNRPTASMTSSYREARQKPQPFPSIGFNFDIGQQLEQLTPIAKKYMTELYGKNYGAKRVGGDYGSSLGDARLAAYGADKFLGFLSPLFQTSYNNALQSYQAKYNQALNTYNAQNAWRNRIANMSANYRGGGGMTQTEYNPFTNSMFGNNTSSAQQNLPQQTGAIDPYSMFTPYSSGSSGYNQSPMPSASTDYYNYNQRPSASSEYYGRF